MLVRKISHLLHKIRPGSRIASQLEPEPEAPSLYVPARGERVGMAAEIRVIRKLLAETDQWLRTEAPLAERGIEPTVLAMEEADHAAGGRVVRAEVWPHERFVREGSSAIAQLAREDGLWMLVVCERATDDRQDLERMAQGMIPTDRAGRISVISANLNAMDSLVDMVRERVVEGKCTILVVRDGPPAKFDERTMERELSDVDRLGYEPTERVNQSVGSACDFVEPAAAGETLESETELETKIQTSRYVRTDGPGLSVRFRALQEQVSVVRIKPPALNWLNRTSQKLPLPTPIHGAQTSWRAHVAGCRGREPGAAGIMLMEAGRAMGYAVASVFDPAPIGSGLRAWSQILFFQPSPNGRMGERTAVVPFGEADLLLGLDIVEAARAVDRSEFLRVASRKATSAVVNVEDDQEDRELKVEAMVGAVKSACKEAAVAVKNFERESQVRFHTERLTDMVMLGAAFQMGFVPISLEAAEAGLAEVESRGYGRARLAFEYGRHLAAGTVQDVRETRRELDADGLIRYAVRMLRCHGWWARRNAKAFGDLMRRTVAAMPGLGETRNGRDARADFVRGAMRCVLWGGMRYATQFAELMMKLYEADKGERGRMLTCEAIVPLADVMLIHDSLYTFRMLSSAEHRRRLRELLDVRRGRGDEVTRNIVTRVDVATLGRRVRADVRTGAWLVRVVGWGCRFVPTKMRGSVLARERRQLVLDFALQAVREAGRDYEKWLTVFKRLNAQSREARLHEMAISELRMFAGAQDETLHQGAETAA